jgi:FkbM family methyltransferase
MQDSDLWCGDAFAAWLILWYARTLPQHRGKHRLFRAFSRKVFPDGIPLRNGHGDRIVVDPLDYIGHTICFDGTWEPLSLALARRLLQDGGTLLDVGANFGLYTCCLSRIPGVRCIAVDASPVAFSRLLLNLKWSSAGQVTAVNVAVGSTSSLVNLETPHVMNLGTTRVAAATPTRSAILQKVALLPLDQILSGMVDRPIQLMKIDIEGYELEAFRGMQFSAAYRPRNILVEHTARAVADGAALDACFEILHQNAYTPYTVTGEPFCHSMPLPEENLWWRDSQRPTGFSH